MNAFRFLGLWVLLLGSFGFATEEEVLGGHEGWMDRMGAGIHELGRGNTGTAMLEAAPAAFWNPAVLPFSRKTQFGMGADLRSLDRKGGFISLQGALTGNLAVGLGILHRGDFNVVAYDADEKPVGTARPQAFGSYLGMGLRTSRKNAVGVSIQSYSSNMDVGQSYGDVTFVGGVNLAWFRRWGDSLNTAVVLRNLGLNQDLSADYDQIVLGDGNNTGFETTAKDFFPKTLVVAVEWKKSLWKRPWAFSLEAIDYQLKRNLYVVDANFHRQALRLGVEWEIVDRVQFRGGMDRGNLTMGFGYVYPWGRRKLKFDYALVMERGLLTFNPYAAGLRTEF